MPKNSKQKPKSKRKQRIEYFNLPDGSVTRSPNRYVKEWRALAKPICKEFGWTQLGYEPGIAFHVGRDGGPIRKGEAPAGTICLSRTICLKLKGLIEELEKKRPKPVDRPGPCEGCGRIFCACDR